MQLYGTLLHNLWVMPFVIASEKMSMISVRAVIAFCDRNGVSLSLFNNVGGRSSPSLSDDCDWLQESKETETEWLPSKWSYTKCIQGNNFFDDLCDVENTRRSKQGLVCSSLDSVSMTCVGFMTSDEEGMNLTFIHSLTIIIHRFKSCFQADFQTTFFAINSSTHFTNLKK